MKRTLVYLILVPFMAACAHSAAVPAPSHQGSAIRRNDHFHQPIQHVVIIVQENRSFDHFMGWLPNANGLQSPIIQAGETLRLPA